MGTWTTQPPTHRLLVSTWATYPPTYITGYTGRSAARYLNWTPVIIFCLLRRFKLNERYREISSFIIVSSVLIFLQPIFAGPDVVLKNLIRLTNLAYPMVILYIFSNSSFRILNKKIAILLSIPFFLFWSSHPTYSIFDFLNFN